jgi:hypothetical protein
MTGLLVPLVAAVLLQGPDALVVRRAEQTAPQAVLHSQVRIHVTSAAALPGRTDQNKTNEETVKDLRKSLSDYPEIRLVDTPEEAVISLIVQDGDTANFTAAAPGPGRDRGMWVKLRYRGLETELKESAPGGTLTAGGARSKAAGKVAKQVHDWIAANRTRIEADGK